MSRQRVQKHVLKETVVSVTCDACGKREQIAEDVWSAYSWEPRGWVHFNSGHNEWGNDSVDSEDAHDVCSFACYVAVMRDLHKRWGEYKSFTADGKGPEFIAALIATGEGEAVVSFPPNAGEPAPWIIDLERRTEAAEASEQQARDELVRVLTESQAGRWSGNNALRVIGKLETRLAACNRKREQLEAALRELMQDKYGEAGLIAQKALASKGESADV